MVEVAFQLPRDNNASIMIMEGQKDDLIVISNFSESSRSLLKPKVGKIRQIGDKSYNRLLGQVCFVFSVQFPRLISMKIASLSPV